MSSSASCSFPGWRASARSVFIVYLLFFLPVFTGLIQLDSLGVFFNFTATLVLRMLSIVVLAVLVMIISIVFTKLLKIVFFYCDCNIKVKKSLVTGMLCFFGKNSIFMHTTYWYNLFPLGWPRRAAYSAEEMDFLPESQAGLLHAWTQLCLQRCTWHFHSERGNLEGHCHLWSFHFPVVSVFSWRKI